jgi:mono/diheme cytochrome c family protein
MLRHVRGTQLGGFGRVAALGLLLAASVGCGGDAASGSTGSEQDSDSDSTHHDASAPAKHKDAGAAPSSQPSNDPSSAPKGGKDAGPGVDAASDDNKTSDTPSAGDGSFCAVQTIVTKHCTACHDGKGTGGSPMGLLTHDDYLAAAKSDGSKKVFTVIESRVHDVKSPMPPKGNLTDDELKTIDSWVAAGAPDGTCTATTDPNTPDADGRVDGWNPDECDEIYEIRSHGAGGVKDP